MRNMWGAYGKARARTAMTFVSQAAYKDGIKEKLGLEKTVLPIRNCRNIGKKDMILNDKTPVIEVDPKTYEVTVDGEKALCTPSGTLPLTQRYYLF
jgi:urease subunit alpha